MDRGKVIITEPIHSAGLDILKRETELVYLPDEPDRQLSEVVADAQGLGVRVTRVTGEIIAGAPKLKVIGKHGVGYDNIDVAAATARGIVVINTPEANKMSVSEHILSLMFCLANKICVANADLRSGNFRAREDYTGIELEGKTIGVVGLGRIGSETTRRCRSGLGMTVISYDPYVSAEKFESAGCARADTLGQLLEKVDFVALCVPLTSETAGMIGAREISRMKPDAYLINTARGGIVDEAALYRSLADGKIAAAAMDVFVKEPPTVEHPLLSLDNFIATPHVGGATKEAMRRMATGMAEEILRVLRGGRPLNPVNPEVYE